MELIGFIVCSLLLVKVSAAWAVFAWFCLGEFTIGGARNHWSAKLIVIVTGVMMIALWYLLATNAPFTINWN